MFVYFIFNDDYNIYDIENDHQDIINMNKSSSWLRSESESESDTQTCPKQSILRKKRKEEESCIENDLCSLCLEEIYFPRNMRHPEKRIDYVFCDLTKYNYDNREYTHTCSCTPSLHCVCFIDIYHKQMGCLICKKEIHWKYKYLHDKINHVYDYIHDNMWQSLHLIMNIGFLFYVLSVIIDNMTKDDA